MAGITITEKMKEVLRDWNPYDHYNRNDGDINNPPFDTLEALHPRKPHPDHAGLLDASGYTTATEAMILEQSKVNDALAAQVEDLRKPFPCHVPIAFIIDKKRFQIRFSDEDENHVTVHIEQRS